MKEEDATRVMEAVTASLAQLAEALSTLLEERDEILTLAQAAELAKVSQRTVVRAIEAGDLRASRLTQTRGGWRVYRSAVDDWMDLRANIPRPMWSGRPRPRPIYPEAPGGGPRRSEWLTAEGRIVVPPHLRSK